MALTIDSTRGLVILTWDIARHFELITCRLILHIISKPVRTVAAYEWVRQKFGGNLGHTLPAHNPADTADLYRDRVGCFELRASPWAALASLTETADVG